MSFLANHKIALVVIGVLIAGFGWHALSDGSSPEPILSAQQIDASGAVAEKGLVETLITLRAISLSGRIFSDPAFLSLQDFGTQIVPEPIGRPDPFAPLEGGVRPTGETGASGSGTTPGRRP